MQDEGFITIPFPKDEDIVYILSYRRGEDEPAPFYVGESRRSTRRIGDYLTAQFAAPTDFKVGTAIKALQAAGCEVLVHYKLSNNRRQDEKAWIERLTGEGYALLNHERSFNHKTAKEDEERARIQMFVQSLLKRKSSHYCGEA
jgi:hypothetical protein